jgi:hypothetical protein
MLSLVMAKQELTELTNKLFMYTDAQNWDGLVTEVFTDKVNFDMSSLGAEPQKLDATAICDQWREGFKELDAVHHQAGHYLINVEADKASIFAYAIAVHLKKSAAKGSTRTFIGDYDLKAVQTKKGWRLCSFTYHVKIMDGNISFE